MSTISTRREFHSSSARGLRQDLPPMRLWHKAKKLGTWDPADIDFTQDMRDWKRLDDGQKDLLLRLTSLFVAGEESVTLDLLPLVQVIAGEGRIEEEMYLTSFLWEEAKHVDAFRRFLDEVAGSRAELGGYHGPTYSWIFYEELPRSMNRLRDDPSPAAQAEASVTYNLIVEGVLAETGYHSYYSMLRRNELMPGMQKMVDLIKRDESRHLAYGVYLLSRLLAEHGDAVWEVIERRMGELLGPAIEITNELFACYDVMPFGLKLEEFVEYSTGQFQKRMARIESVRGMSLEQVNKQAADEE
jgi:ribonucleoside-diphosphate reductase beta chain